MKDYPTERLLDEVAARRADPEFMGRLRSRIESDGVLLRALADRPTDEPTEADPYPDGLPEDLYVDIESTIHQHCGHDGQSDEANDWVTDLMSAISPLIVRALVGGRSAAPTRERLDDLIEDLRPAGRNPDVMAYFDNVIRGSLLDSLVALLSRPAEPPEAERILDEARSLMRTARSLDPTKPVSNELLGQVFGDLIDLLAPDGVAAEPKEEHDDG